MSHNEKKVQTKDNSIPFPKNTQKGKRQDFLQIKLLIKQLAEIRMKNLFIKIMMKLRRRISYRQKLRKHI